MRTNALNRTERTSQNAIATVCSSAVSAAARCAAKVMRAWFPSSSQTLVDNLRIELTETN